MVKFNIEKSIPETLELQNINRFLVEGWLFGSSRIRSLAVYVGDMQFNAQYTEIYRPDVRSTHMYEDPASYSLFSGFSVPVILEPVRNIQNLEIQICVNFSDGSVFKAKIGSVTLEPFEKSTNEIKLPANTSEEDLLVICMATYNPEEERFKRQIESIISQDYENWICIVCDDCSREKNKVFIKSILGKDARFVFVENQVNLGFYLNFERCLGLVPSFAKYVALSDQDDYWYSNKLSSCLQKLVGPTQLVYCDMRIVLDSGEVLSDTYWKTRKNYYKNEDIDLLAIANTVTGAASVFRSDLLGKILPFPPRYGDVYHDQWIAVIAALGGGIDYVDAPLYDYIQSGNNVIGHVDFGRTSLANFLLPDHFRQSISHDSKGLSAKLKIACFLHYLSIRAQELYYFNHRYGKHIFTIIETALVRYPESQINSILRRPRTLWGLIRLCIKSLIRSETTNNNDLALLFSKFINTAFSICIPILHKIVLAKGTNQLSMPLTGIADPVVAEYKRKFSGRRFELVKKKQQINFLLSRLDPDNFFGGYIGMFNFAKKYSEAGYPVRILLTDQQEISDDDLRRIQNHDLSLKGFLTEAEYLPCYSSEQIVPIAENDIFVATSWWTAYIANEALSRTIYSKFIYLAQDYEPVFYEHGSYRVLADNSYKLSYFPFFSTDILQRYFVETGMIKPKASGEYFKNPVLDFSLEAKTFQRKSNEKRKLLFYGRPQPHNARNLYAIGCLAIDRAREMGYFPEDEWEVLAIGGFVAEQLLPSGIKIKHIGKFDMGKYKELLPQHDVGLALMDSPHPSLLPIEMASAGLLVVTNTYGIKDQDYFNGISTNIRAVSPDFEALAQALIEASQKVDDIDTRIAGSKVNWPHTWNEALPVSHIEKAISTVKTDCNDKSVL